MSNLNTYEIQALANIEYQLNFIQTFIDENITNDIAMTARIIYQRFCEEYECTESEQDFILGFKAAIKTNRITGIHGVRGVGFRRIGSGASRGSYQKDKSIQDSTNDSNSFEEWVNLAQEFVDKYITNDVSMTISKVYELFCKEHNYEDTEQNFIIGFKEAIRAERITGIEGVRGVGYRRLGSSVSRGSTSLASKNESKFKALVPALDEFLGRALRGGNRMPAKDIYHNFSKSNDCPLLEEDFVNEFRAAVRDGVIKGLVSFRRAGYGREFDKAVTEDRTQFIVNNTETNTSRPKESVRSSFVTEYTPKPVIKIPAAFKVLPEISAEYKENKASALDKLKTLVYDSERTGQKLNACIFRSAAVQLMNDQSIDHIHGMGMDNKQLRQTVGF